MTNLKTTFNIKTAAIVHKMLSDYADIVGPEGTDTEQKTKTSTMNFSSQHSTVTHSLFPHGKVQGIGLPLKPK